MLAVSMMHCRTTCHAPVISEEVKKNNGMILFEGKETAWKHTSEVLTSMHHKLLPFYDFKLNNPTNKRGALYEER